MRPMYSSLPTPVNHLQISVPRMCHHLCSSGELLTPSHWWGMDVLFLSSHGPCASLCCRLTTLYRMVYFCLHLLWTSGTWAHACSPVCSDTIPGQHDYLLYEAFLLPLPSKEESSSDQPRSTQGYGNFLFSIPLSMLAIHLQRHILSLYVPVSLIKVWLSSSYSGPGLLYPVVLRARHTPSSFPSVICIPNLSKKRVYYSFVWANKNTQWFNAHTYTHTHTHVCVYACIYIMCAHII